MIQALPPVAVVTTFALLGVSILGLWVGRAMWSGALLLAVVAGYAGGVLVNFALLWIVLLAAACILYRRVQWPGAGAAARALKALAAVAILLLSVALAAHALPGFHNLLIARDVVLSPGATPYTLYLNFDKTLVGILILGIVYSELLHSASDLNQALQRAAPIVLVMVPAIAILAFALDYLRYDPKWPALFWTWAASNLLLTCLSEEAFFRGFVQRELQNAWRHRSYGGWLAVTISATTFGIAHFAGGVSYVLLATAAGFAYALVYRITDRVEMSMLAHFTLNTIHFLLFTYPRAA